MHTSCTALISFILPPFPTTIPCLIHLPPSAHCLLPTSSLNTVFNHQPKCTSLLSPTWLSWSLVQLPHLVLPPVVTLDTMSTATTTMTAPLVHSASRASAASAVTSKTTTARHAPKTPNAPSALSASTRSAPWAATSNAP